jgi:hypothetical protein
MFCSRSLGVHLLRGLLAIALLGAALLIAGAHPALRIGALAGAALLLRGCPACWLVGLFETWTQGRSSTVNRCIATSSTSARGGEPS